MERDEIVWGSVVWVGIRDRVGAVGWGRGRVRIAELGVVRRGMVGGGRFLLVTDQRVYMVWRVAGGGQWVVGELTYGTVQGVVGGGRRAVGGWQAHLCRCVSLIGERPPFRQHSSCSRLATCQ